MNARFVPLCIAAASLAAATPALAGEPLPMPPVPQAPALPQPAMPPMGHHPMAQQPMVMPAPQGVMPAAPQADYQRARADWLNECTSRYLEDRRDGNGGILGGLLGAVIGGVAGNRIAGHGDRLAGTLIGGGAGGIAGVLIGSAIDRGRLSKREDEALDWCEDYLARNSQQAPAQYAQPYPYAYPYPQGEVA